MQRETVRNTLDRLVQAPTRRAPFPTSDPPQIEPLFTERQRAIVTEAMKIWMLGAGLACSFSDLLLQTEAVSPEAVRTLNGLLDAIKPFDPLIETMTKYCGKLQLAQLGIENVFDVADDFRFMRDIKDELRVLP